MPRARVTRRVHFSAGHRLHNPDFSDSENRETYGLCNNPSGHGHNYELEVTVEGEVDPATGYVMDLKRLKSLLGEAVLSDLDHANLNVDVDWLRGVIPTTENLAVAIWRRLEGGLPGVRLVSVRLWETERNSVEYRGE
jgi:6-pyruvoyltetrahydropterin/6-carboxytetrahydropterin synthase